MDNLTSIETERKVLGLIIKDPKIFEKFEGIILEEDFSDNFLKQVIKEIISLKNNNRKISEILLSENLELSTSLSKKEVDIRISEILIDAGLETRIDHYIEILKEKTTKRKLEIALREGLNSVKSKNLNTLDLITSIESEILKVTKSEERFKDFSNIEELTSEFSKKLEDIKKHGYNEGIQSGFPSLDKILGGWKKGDFSIVAARPSMGKTAFALEIVKNISKKHRVGFFSLEMPSEQLLQRMVISEAMLNFKEVREYNKLSQDKQNAFEFSMDKIKGLKLWIDDSPQGIIEELTWKARRLNERIKLDFIVIDYLQLLTSRDRRENRQQQVSDISRILKQLARELDVPILALSQLSRNVENRTDKKPLMSDIRESGAIEQDADSIMMLYRDKYYNNEDNDLSNVQELDISISKNRNGPTGFAKLNFDLQVGKIKDKGGF